jgi:hypothetical protein
VPFTFFAHQAPVLPLARRWPGRIDGLALVVGTMAPDLAFVLDGTRLALDAHTFPASVLFALPVTIAVAWIVARVLAPVVPDHLPDLAPFHLRDYRGLATHRFRPVVTSVSALLGVLAHIGLDQFTHSWGWFARNLDWYSVPRFDWLGRDWAVFRLLQYAGHVVGTVTCIWLLRSYGRARWMAGRAAAVAPFEPSAPSRLLVWSATAGGLLAGAVWVLVGTSGVGPVVLRLSGCVFAGLTVGAVSAVSVRRVPAVRPAVGGGTS